MDQLDPATVTRTADGITHGHLVAWRLGRKHFKFDGDPPQPRGLLIGEAPGPNTNWKLPLYPSPSNSAAGRLLRYADIDQEKWLGSFVRMNLCDDDWSARRASAGVIRALSFLLDPANYHDGKPLRVLLLGRRVADAWNCGKAQFGSEIRHYTGDSYPNLYLAWIPHPSGRCLVYNDRKNQLRARRAVLWALGERSRP